MTYLEVDDKRFNTSEITQVALHSSTFWTLGDEGWWVEVHLVPKWYTLGRKRVLRLYEDHRLSRKEAERLYDWVYENWKESL